MLNTEPQGGWGTSATAAPPNPFTSAIPPQPPNPFLQQPSNPFSTINAPNTQGPVYNPFAQSAVAFNPFSKAEPTPSKRSVSPSSKQAGGRTAARNPFETAKQASSASALDLSEQPTLAAHRSSAVSASSYPRAVAEFVQPAWRNESDTPPTAATAVRREIGLGGQVAVQSSDSSTVPRSIASKGGPITGFSPKTQSTTSNGISRGSLKKHDGRAYELASKIQQQLSKDRISPPSWPANPGSHAQRQAMESFRESYKVYREKARKSLIKAGLIDDPNQRRTLEQALDFRGISEEMCPEWEKITRIIEYDLRNPEKAVDSSGDFVAEPSLMVKRLARSAAGQDAPLPMDVRSFATLRKTLDYLIDDLIPGDSSLPSKHSFLWDRTRAIRIDLSVQKYNLTPDERADLLYCLETIARFHVTVLHLLSQSGFASEDFSEHQEMEQLGKTLISLKELYDDCVEQGIECPNESEFRAYYIVFNARNPSIKETVERWGSRLWKSDEIRTAMCLVESVQNTWTAQGPLHPYAPTELALNAAAVFFSIISSPQISYTMACFAEIHFTDIRKSMLQTIRKSYTRPRDGPKDITPTFLKERMRFDTEEEAVDFAQKHGFDFNQDGADRYAILNSRQPIKDPRTRHAFSQSIVECKRSGRSLPDIIHHTVYQEDTGKPTIEPQRSLFVPVAEDTSPKPFDNLPIEDDTDISHSTIPSPPVAGQVPSPDIGNHSLFHGSAAVPPSSILSQSTQVPKPEGTTAHPVTPTPKQDASSTPTSLSSQPHSSPLGTHSIFANGVNEKNQLSSSIFLPGPHHVNSPDSQGNKSITLNNTGPPSIFGALNQNKNGSQQSVIGQSVSTPIFNSLATPSLSSDAISREKAPVIATTKPTTTTFPNLFAPSSASAPSQSPGVLNSQPLFQQKQPTVAATDGGASVHGQGLSTHLPQLSPSYAKQEKTAPDNVVPTTNSVSMSSGAKQEKPSITQKTPSVAPLATTVPRKDPMGDFTRWFVLGDNGLMETELEVFAVEHFLKSTFEDFQAAEKDRIRKEEDAQSWAEALKYRHYSLSVTFFYRWLDITRKRRIIKRIKLEKEKARKWKSPHSVAAREVAERTEKENAVQEAKELVRRRSEENARETSMMRESTQSHQSIEAALLATGVFSGLQDERAAAHYAAHDDIVDFEADMFSAEEIRLRSENQRRRKRGLPPLKRFPETKAPKVGNKTALLRAVSRGAGRDSLSMSTSSLRNSTFSSSYRSSLGFNRSRVAKSRSNVSDPYWKMKANGLVQMPNGEYLHESLALPMLQEGKRFPGLGDYGLPPKKSFTPSQSPPARLDIAAHSISPSQIRLPQSSQSSGSSAIYEGPMQKRKRVEPEDDDLAAYRNEPANLKRARSNNQASSAPPSEDQDFLASIANLLDKVDTLAQSSTR
ncbi:hypothetical protein F4861DRAFT_526337 [Xylaria intraflava]|nr:hypothetical protein F4861DRAFT_526337 [Xylaria intraflava]